MAITAAPATFKKYSTETIHLIAKNVGTTPFSDVNVSFQFPVHTVTGGVATASNGIWKEYCDDGMHCFTWAIKNLPINTVATADIPIYILEEASSVSLITTLINSVPADNNAKNNTAYLTLYAADSDSPQGFSTGGGTSASNKLVSGTIETISPNPTNGNIFVAFRNEQDTPITFLFYNALGNVVMQEIRTPQKGDNNMAFNCTALPVGIYYVALQTDNKQFMPVRFVKM